MQSGAGSGRAEAAPEGNDAGHVVLAAVLIVALGFGIYLNGIHGAFLFDDLNNIVKNENIRQLWPSWDIVFKDKRPFSERSFAINYAISDLDPRGYHLFNIGIHVAAALALLGIVRRTLRSEPLRPRYGGASLPLALAVAVIWLAHPLQTESVTYIIQREESLMGLFYLLTLYCAIRGFASERRWAWHAAAVVSCLLGMGTKEVTVTAPLIVLLYDRLFVAGSFRRALKQSAGLYAGLALTWTFLIWLVWHAPALASSGFGMPFMTPAQYAATQFGVIVHYLRLAFWPSPLVLDYKWPLATTVWAILPPALLVGALLAATVWALWALLAMGFLGAWFFLILTPTSTIMPIADVCFEHRMYLPLAAVIALVVCGGYAILQRVRENGAAAYAGLRAGGLLLIVTSLTASSWATVQRNRAYHSQLTIWKDVVAKAPDNDRAHCNLGNALVANGHVSDGMLEFGEALRLNPDFPEAHNNLGQALASLDRTKEALPHFEAAVRLRWKDARAQYNLGKTFYVDGNLAGASEHAAAAVELDPADADAQNLMATILFRQGAFQAGVEHLEAAVRLRPDRALFHYNLGNAYRASGRLNEAIAQYELALETTPTYGEAHFELAKALVAAGKIAEALRHYDEAMRLAPDSPDVMANLAWLRATQINDRFRNGAEALQLARRASALLDGKDIGCLQVLAAAYAETGDFAEARRTAQKALDLAQAKGSAQAAALRRHLESYAAGKPLRQGTLIAE